MTNLQWRAASTHLSKTALMVYLLAQEEGPASLSPTYIQDLGLMSKGTASKAIVELKNKHYLTATGEVCYPLEEIERRHITPNSEKTYSVYRLVFPNGYNYIGITSRNPEARWDCGEGYEYHAEMYKAIVEFGWENVIKTIVASGLTSNEAENMETELIQQLAQEIPLYNKKKLIKS